MLTPANEAALEAATANSDLGVAAALRVPDLIDRSGRTVNYLRVSITDQCNLRCTYCIPPGKMAPKADGERLSRDEILALVGLFVDQGITRVRITGGEPLIRSDVVDIVRGVAAMPGVEEVALSTNGVLLERHIDALADAGLTRVNVSLDSLQPGKVACIAGADTLERIWAGLDAAEARGLGPVKINTVLLRGTNDDEILDFARLTLERPWHVRFIELMPTPWNRDTFAETYLPATEVHDLIQRELGLAPAGHAALGGGPAVYYRIIPDAQGLVGLITPMCESFCERCNRVRLTATGHIRPCLFGAESVDLGGALRAGAGQTELIEMVRGVLGVKPAGHDLWNDSGALSSLVQIGG